MTRREKEPGSNLEAARISRLPGDAFYIPGFITEAEEANLLQKVSTSFAFFVRRAYLGPPCIAYSAIDLSNYKGPPDFSLSPPSPSSSQDLSIYLPRRCKLYC